jgi:hypothetical protein
MGGENIHVVRKPYRNLSIFNGLDNIGPELNVVGTVYSGSYVSFCDNVNKPKFYRISLEAGETKTKKSSKDREIVVL